MKRSNFYLVVISLLLISNGFLVWRFLLHPPQKDHDLPKRIMIKKLQLDAAQVASYEILIQDHRKAVYENDSTITALKKQLYQLLKSEQAQTDTLFQQLSTAHLNTEKIHFDHFQKIRQLCRPDQQQLFDQIIHELTSIFRGQQRKK